MPAGPADPKNDDPWLRAALQAPAGPAAGPAADPGVAPAEPAPEPGLGAGPEPVDAPPAAEEPAARVDPSRVRRLAVQALYVLGNDPEATEAQLVEALDEPFDEDDEDPPAEEEGAAREAAVALARAAWAGHAAADAAVVAQAPAWPTRRQPPVDRAILRLAHHELVTQRAPFAVVIDEAVELAKAFGEDRTPGFVNAVLDAVARGAAPADPGAGATGEVRTSTADHPTSGAVARRAKRDRFEIRKAEMAAKVGPKHPHPRPRKQEQAAAAEAPRGGAPSPEAPEATGPPPAPPAPPEASAPPEAPASPEAPADPWAAAAARRG